MSKHYNLKIGWLIIWAMCLSNIIIGQSELPGSCGEDCIDVKMLDMSAMPDEPVIQSIKLRFMAFNQPLEGLDSIIHYNMATLNEAFDSTIIFEYEDSILLMPKYTETLPELYANYTNPEKNFEEIYKLSEKGFINVFLMPTVEDTLNGRVLLGFTPIYSDWFEGFEQVSPRMDNLFISYDGMLKGTTLTHEMGHFLGLAHPFQLDFQQKKNMGLATEKAICVNFMNYNCFVDRFTEEQVHLMSFFTEQYRKYLTK